MWHHLLALALVLAVHVAVLCRVLLNDDMSSDARAAWFFVLIGFPIIGIVVYLFLGEPWMARSFRRRAATVWEQPIANISAMSAGMSSGLIPDRYRPVFETCASLNGCGAAIGNVASLAADSDAAIRDMVRDFDLARETIHVSFYIWLTDNNGRLVVEALRRAAARGVTCRVVVDAFGSRDLIRSAYWAAMKQSGIKLCVSLVSSLGVSLASISRPDLRNHRKIVVVDNSITYCGSQNCADPEFRIKPRFAPWIDIMLRFEGPVARQNQLVFANDWAVEYGEDLSSLLGEPFPGELEGDCAAAAFGTGPMSPKGSMSDVFVSLLQSAQQEVVISTPYFVPDLQLLASLMASARRKVTTILILPARNDSHVVSAISKAHYARLLASGVKIYEYHGGLLHAKTVVVDGQLTLVGSANMDFRSLYLNFENNILFYSDKNSGDVRARQDIYISSSTQVDEQDVKKRPRLRRIYDNLLTIVGPVF
ncbi:cardiolipin synthase [Labrys neptuniae]|uniref:cardiolipin synthase n=1 Tax=Labrys neptuniae TaxID=376174 RepID=UPI00288F0233|nr:cardiolipin synthase [Labrys neptuniae]MDT3379408.1 cardiolipin synthase [Labrys neptuniae]